MLPETSRMDSTTLSLSNMTSSRRRETLWNVLEPGDPYDIRKSMIANFPDDKKPFMGDHLEITCLLQTAQIERLCQFLDEYKLKYRELQRRELDRHSYEVQIKELTQRITDETALKNDLAKYKDFIQKQAIEIQSLQKSQRGVDDELKVKYESSLRQLDILVSENASLKATTESQSMQIQTFYVKMQVFERAKNKEIEQLYLQISQQGRLNYEQELASIRSKHENQMLLVEFELKRVRELNQSKNMEIDGLMRVNQSLQNEVNAVNSKVHDSGDYQKKIAEYESKFLFFGREVQRLNLVVQDNLSKLTQVQMQKSELLENYTRLSTEYESINEKYTLATKEILSLKSTITMQQETIRKLSQGQDSLTKSERTIFDLRGEIERINTRLRNEIADSQKLRDELRRLSFDSSKFLLVQKENNAMKETLQEYSAANRKIVEYQSKISQMNAYMEKSAKAISDRDLEILQLRRSSSDNEDLKRRLTEIERSLTSRYELQITKKVEEYEQRIKDINKAKGSEWELRFNNMSAELQRAKESIKAKNTENDSLKRQMSEYELRGHRYELQASKLTADFNSAFAKVKRENEELSKKLLELGEAQRKVGQFERKVFQASLQIERLSSLLQTSNAQITTLKSRIQKDSQISKKLSNNEAILAGFSQENDLLKQRLKDSEYVRSQLQNRIIQLTQQAERSRQIIKQYEQEHELLRKQISEKISFEGEYSRKITNYEQRFNLVSKQNEDYKKKILELGEGMRRLTEYETKLVFMNQEMERLSSTSRLLAQENDNLKRQLKQREGSMNQYEAEMTRKVQLYEQSLSAQQHQNEELRRRLQELGDVNRRVVEYESKVSFLAQQIQRISQMNHNLSVENESYRKMINESKNSVLEYSRKVSIYEGNLGTLTKENDELKRRTLEINQLTRRLVEYENKLSSLLQENERTTANYRLKVEQCNRLESNLRNYEQNISMLTKENEELRRRLQQLGDMNRKLAEYESKIAFMSQQIERLNANLRNKSQEYNRTQSRLKTTISELQSLKRQYSQMQLAISHKLQYEVTTNYQSYEQRITMISRQNDENKRKFSEAQNKIAMLSQEIERLNGIMKIKQDEMNKIVANYNNLVKENEEMRRHIKESEGVMGQAFNTLKTENQGLKRNLQEYEQNMRGLSNDNERLNSRLKEIQLFIKNKYEIEVNNKYAVYESNIASLNRDNEQLRRRLMELGEANRRVAQLQNKLAIMTNENERLNTVLSRRNEQASHLDQKVRQLMQENEGVRREGKELQITMTKRFESDMAHKVATYQSSIASYARDNDQLRRRLNELSQSMNNKYAQYQNKLALLSQEIQRLNGNLKVKSEQSQKTQLQLATIKRQSMERMQITESEYERLLVSYGQVTKEYDNTKQHLLNYQQVVRKLSEEFQRLQKIINQLKQENASLIKKNHALSDQIERITQISKNLEDQAKEIRLRLADETALQKRVNEHMSLMVILFAEIESLRRRVKDKEKQCEQVRRSSLAPFIV